jgi:predicted acetyltransferase
MAFEREPSPIAGHTPPHAAQPRLVSVTDDTLADFFAAGVHGFHAEFHTDEFEAERPTANPERFFGFQVGDRWVSTCGSQDRTMITPGGSVPVAAVTLVTVAPGYRRRGLLRQMMHHQLTEVIGGGERPLALLWASESGIYGRFGFGPVTAMAQLSGLTDATAFRAGTDLGAGSVDEVSCEEYLAAAPDIRASLLPCRPGHLDRPEAFWRAATFDPERQRQGTGPRRYAIHFAPDGDPDGFATFRIKRHSSITDLGAEVVIEELEAANPAAYARLWRWLLDLDLVRAFSVRHSAVDAPIRQLVSNTRMLKTTLIDGTYARIVDVAGALQSRTYVLDLDTVLEVTDDFLPQVAGRYRLRAGVDGAMVERTDTSPDVTVSIRELSASYLGAAPLTQFLHAGLLAEHTPGSAARISAAFGSSRTPWCPDDF